MSPPQSGKVTMEKDRHFIDINTELSKHSQPYSLFKIATTIMCDTWVDSCVTFWCWCFMIPFAIRKAREEKREHARLGKTKITKRVLPYPPITFNRMPAVVSTKPD
mmetsp:Transcript_16990/g.26317  ORF Transcript_16990/g.26317 Transcript_16990/m.26317 type:complete len:106 (-) Transcript_16990:343-660(-)